MDHAIIPGGDQAGRRPPFRVRRQEREGIDIGPVLEPAVAVDSDQVAADAWAGSPWPASSNSSSGDLLAFAVSDGPARQGLRFRGKCFTSILRNSSRVFSVKICKARWPAW